MAKRFIQKLNLKKGALHRQLEISPKKTIPVSLLKKISKTKTGKIITNPTSVGKKKIKVTNKLGARVNVALTLRSLKNG